MIRCSKCGNLNRDGSRFCNECGHTLQRTQVRCPMCGTLNPVGNVFCDRCNARLVPVQSVIPEEEAHNTTEDTITGVRGISLPARAATPDAPTAASDEEIPDWLQSLLEDTPDTAPRTAVPEPATALPDWLGGAEIEAPSPVITPPRYPRGRTTQLAR